MSRKNRSSAKIVPVSSSFSNPKTAKAQRAVNILMAPQNLFRCTQKLNYYCENLARDTGDKGDRASIQFRENSKSATDSKHTNSNAKLYR